MSIEMVSWPALSQFQNLKIRRLANFMKLGNVERRILMLRNCEKVGRDEILDHFYFFICMRYNMIERFAVG